MLMLNTIKKIFGMEHKISSIPFLKAINDYPYYVEAGTGKRVNIGQYSIVSVRAFQKRNKVRVIVETHRPGYFIGEKGRHIKAIRELMEKRCGQSVDIHIVESRMFLGLWRS